MPQTRLDKTENESLVTLHGHLYERGQYVVAPPHDKAYFDALRAVYPDGRIGPPLVINDPKGLETVGDDIGEGLEGPGGSELLLVYAHVNESHCAFAIRHRTSDGTSYGPPTLLIRHLAFCDTPLSWAVQSQNHRTLVTLEQEPGKARLHGLIGSRGIIVSSVEISPQGKVGPVRVAERFPARTEAEEPSIDYESLSAISNSGNSLIALTSSVTSAPIWLRPTGARCPGYGPKIPIGHGDLLAVFAGHHGVFHIAWTTALGELKITSAQVNCRTPASTRSGQ
jgi:hypothetical protein